MKGQGIRKATPKKLRQEDETASKADQHLEMLWRRGSAVLMQMQVQMQVQMQCRGGADAVWKQSRSSVDADAEADAEADAVCSSVEAVQL